MGSPVISRTVQYSLPMENGEWKNSIQPKVVEETEVITNRDPLTNAQSNNGTVRSVDANHHSDSITNRQYSESITSDSNESVRDAFTTISVYF